MLDWLCPETIYSMLSQLAVNDVKVLMTTRLRNGIEDSSDNTLHIKINYASVQTDIKRYIDWRFAKDVGLKNINPQLKQKIRNCLLKKSGGMYFRMWISELIVELNGCNVNLMLCKSSTAILPD